MFPMNFKQIIVSKDYQFEIQANVQKQQIIRINFINLISLTSPMLHI